MAKIEKHVCTTCGNAECAASQETIGLDVGEHTGSGWEKDGPYIFFDDTEALDLGAPRTRQLETLRDIQRTSKK